MAGHWSSGLDEAFEQRDVRRKPDLHVQSAFPASGERENAAGLLEERIWRDQLQNRFGTVAYEILGDLACKH